MITKCATCPAPATHQVTVVIDAEHDASGAIVAGRFDTRSYCTQGAALAVEEIAHGEPPNAELVCVISMCRRRVAS